MLYIIGKRGDESFLTKTANYRGSTPTKEDMLNKMVEKYGGSADDYSALEISDDAILNRLSKGDEFNLVWKDNEIDSLDFTPEDSKRQIEVTVDKKLNKFGVDSVAITGKIKNPDGTVSTDFSGEVVMTMKTPNGNKKLVANFVDGKVSHNFDAYNDTTNGVGEYTLPLEYHIQYGNEEFRNLKSAKFDFVMPIGY